MAPLVIFSFFDSFNSSVDRKEVFLEELLEVRLYYNRKDTCGGFFVKYFFKPFQDMAISGK